MRACRGVTPLFLIIVSLLAPPTAPAWSPPTLAPVANAPPAPFKPRRRLGVKAMKPKGKGLTDLHRWPAETASPTVIDVERLATALPRLCGWMGPKRRRQFAAWFVEHGAAHGVDPFLLAAVIYRSSRCLPHRKIAFGVGLGGVHVRMHRAHVHKAADGDGWVYRFHVLQRPPADPIVAGQPLAGQPPAALRWTEHTRPVPSRLSARQLKRQENNIEWTAVLLAVAKAQCPQNDGVFGSVPHRHFTSHVVWGDRVRDAGAEDRVLRARRRLIGYYLDALPPALPAAVWPASAENPGEPLPLRAPLDAQPRKVFSGLGKPRANGKRKHKGIDFDSSGGEPVRAVAAGKVLFAGVDWPRGTASERLPFKEARALRSSTMGPGGLFVMIHHGQTRTSAYMHLATYTVETGDKVEAGQRIGTVGRTGVKSSGAHLHFELRQDGKHRDPLPILDPYLFRPEATWYGRWDASLPQRRRARRRKETR
ncbi:MAG: murein DD-endopeptidase MepM/ murein hydrolase activator NlpD [Bradymonadia bacterium]